MNSKEEAKIELLKLMSFVIERQKWYLSLSSKNLNSKINFERFKQTSIILSYMTKWIDEGIYRLNYLPVYDNIQNIINTYQDNHYKAVWFDFIDKLNNWRIKFETDTKI